MKERMNSIAICVLGAHRSGTSTITRGLNLFGAYLGEDEDLMPPMPDNPEGFWERMDIYYLHDRILSVMGRDWTTSLPLPENWHTADEIRTCKDELIKLVTRNFSTRPLWVWKDPRTCLLMPLWKDVLSDLDIGLKVIFVVRNPLDVARSLEKRNGFPLHKGLGMWFTHSLVALKSVEDLETIFMSYDRFITNWETELKKCAATLAIEWPADEAELRTKMSSFVRHDLRHSVSGLDELQTAKVPAPIIRLYALLLDLQSGTGRLNSDTGFMTEELYQEFFRYARKLNSDMDRLQDYPMKSDKPLIARLSSRLKSFIFQTTVR